MRMPPPMRIACPPPIPPPWKPPPPKPRASADDVVVIKLAAPSAATAAMASIEVRILVNMALSLGCFAGCELIVRLLVAPYRRVGSSPPREFCVLLPGLAVQQAFIWLKPLRRSEERRVGKECRSG